MIISEFISTYGTELLYTIITAILTYIGVRIKNIYENHIKDNLKKNIIEDTVKYVEQLHSYKTCNEKHEIAKTNILILLSEKNISITDLELEILLESACNNLKKEKSKITEITNN
jgi:transposase-like protein